MPGKFCGQRNLAGYSSWGQNESDMSTHVDALTPSKKENNEIGVWNSEWGLPMLGELEGWVGVEIMLQSVG